MRVRFTDVAVIAILFVGAALAAEKKIQRSALPAAVDKAVQEQVKGATIKGFSMETEKGKTVYEVEMTLNGHGKDVSISQDGRVLETEEEVSVDALPTAVKSVLIARAGSAKIVKVEEVSKAGRAVFYEASILKGTRRAEIAVGPNGEKVNAEAD